MVSKSIVNKFIGTSTYIFLIFCLQLLERERAQDAIRNDQRNEHDVREDERKRLPGHAEGRQTPATLFACGHRWFVRGHRTATL